MCCRAAQALLVVMLVVVECVATPPHSHVYSQQETLQDIAVNQMADPCLRMMKEEVIPILQAMEGQIKAMQEFIGNSSESQQPNQQPPFLDINHNDTNPSLGSQYKVLYGSRGSLSPSYPQFYQHNVRYEWRVILPDRTRPVFTWEFIDIENRCDYEYVKVSSGAVESPNICGASIPTDSHPMYNITDNEFNVVFATDHSVSGRGFILHYTAELAP